MKKLALLFAAAVLAPSLVLAWLALRSLRDQQVVMERQQTLLYEGLAASLAGAVREAVAGQQAEFARQVQALIANQSPREAAPTFDARLRSSWPLAEVGFVVSLDGQMLAPPLFGDPEARQFRLENERFLCGRETVEVYWPGAKEPDVRSPPEAKGAASKEAASAKEPGAAGKPFIGRKGTAPDAAVRGAAGGPPIQAGSEQTGFTQLVGNATQGSFARFLQDRLKLLFWHRPAGEPDLVFGAQINLGRLIEALQSALDVASELRGDVCAALLDDAGRPVAVSPHESGTETRPPDWQHPFLSLGVGEVLPHWKIGICLVNPDRLRSTARTLQLTLGLLIALLVLAIGVGGGLIVADLRRQLTLARQKTDFVSNVSHELKTPLTSIRLFAELLAEGRVQDPDRQRHFLQVITAETARLTRLINNVLDFARLERGEKKYPRDECDLAALVRETVEVYRPSLEASGFALECTTPPAPVPVRGDRDALAQVLVNLLSNAEKYSGARKEIVVRLELPDDTTAVVRVLDRGLGVPAGCEEKIFEQFYRAHDSLAGGIQGAGLGLTLARQTARAHGGDVRQEPREGGGSCFTLRLPLVTSPPAGRPET